MRWPTWSRGSCSGSPPRTSRRIVERAEGVPLYAVETVRMLADRGILGCRRPVPAEGRPGSARDPGVAAGAHRVAPGRARAERPIPPAGRLRPGEEFPRSSPWSRSPGRRDAGTAATRARAQGVPGAGARPPVARARPVRVPARRDPRGGLRHAVEGGPAREAPGHGPPPGIRRGRRARRRRRGALRRGVPCDARGPGCGSARRPRARLALPGERASAFTGLLGTGVDLRGAGPGDHTRRPRARGSAPAGGAVRHRCRERSAGGRVLR